MIAAGTKRRPLIQVHNVFTSDLMHTYTECTSTAWVEAISFAK